MVEHPTHHEFFVDNKHFETEKTALTGLEIKQMAGVTPNYQLFLEEPGPDPDRAISDGESVDMTHGTRHFYSVPPATFGRA